MLRLPSLLVCASLALSTGCASDDTMGNDGGDSSDSTVGDTTEGAETDTGSADMTGQELYMGLCSGCHGPEAEGTNIAYELRHPHDEFSRWMVRNGRNSVEFANQVMPQFSAQVLPDGDLDLILEYLDGFPQPTTPEGLYLDYCRNCHGVDAAGGVVGKELLNSPIQDFIENTRQGRGGSNYGARLFFMPSRGADELSDAEIQAIFDHVGTL